MSLSVISFSAQFGGSDAAAAVLPHFKALKAAANEFSLEGFPLAELAFIFRVDGEVSTYGFSGAGDLEIDKDGQYIAVDVGITQEDRSKLTEVIKEALLSGVQSIMNHRNSDSWNIDYQAVQQCLNDLCARYESELDSRVVD